MKKVLFLLTFAISVVQTFAIPGLTVQQVGPHILLSWPSTPGATYIIQHRSSFSSTTPWTSLATSFPASSGTSTTFLHENQIEDVELEPGEAPPPGGPPIPSSSSLQSSEKKPKNKDKNKLVMPPLPWESFTMEEPTLSLMTESSSANLTQMGFYQVVQVGVKLYGVTQNQTVSGVVNLAVEVGDTGAGSLVSVYLDDTNTEDAPAGTYTYEVSPTQNHPSFSWETYLNFNGTYPLSVVALFDGNRKVVSPTIHAVINNQIQIPEWIRGFGSSQIVRALIPPNTVYSITVQDPNGATVRVLNGTSAANGLVYQVWDGKNANGIQATGDYFDFEISFNPSVKPRAYRMPTSSLVSGHWVVAHQNIFTGVNGIVFNNNLNNVVQFLTLDAEQTVVTGSKYAIGTGAGGWVAVGGYLGQTQTRNLYFFGHGGPDRIGFGANDPGFGLTAGNIRGVLGNVVNQSQYTINRPYRFVFLDGCNTGAKSSEWPDAFGIKTGPLSRLEYTSLGLAPSAFVGWKNKIYTSPGFDSSRHTFTVNFFEEWVANGQDLDTALRTAATGTIGINNDQGYNGLRIGGCTTIFATNDQ